ncbi:hypothetical protein SAMN05660668_01641 [Pseudobutyrivibrio sp. AR14]|uniref:hypothetical protein n=1 Tax=Pseudobutyrivibrio sp. AR14 TaxID=1520804 RepID=UPI00087E2DED|nr:hypothetical protein [Pseudobutyrivibrio sp. AR14]SCY16075.1 hypothetical protein SAMN05660668_01641 [Pseudobutyrivibrio sp. AR14]
MGNAMGKMLNESDSKKALNNLKKQRKELEDYVNSSIEPSSVEFFNATNRLQLFDAEIALLQNAIQQGDFSAIKNQADVTYDNNLAKNYINAIRTSRINERIDAYEKGKKSISDYARRNHLENTEFNFQNPYSYYDHNIKFLQDALENGDLSLADGLPSTTDDIKETTSNFLNELENIVIENRIIDRINTYDEQLNKLQSYVQENELEEPQLAKIFRSERESLRRDIESGNYSAASLPENNNDIINSTTSYINNMQQIKEMKDAINNMYNAPYSKKQNNTTEKKPIGSDSVTQKQNAKPDYPTRASSLDPTPALKRLEKMSKNQILPPRTEARPSNDFFCSDYSNTSLSSKSSFVSLNDISFESTNSNQSNDKGKAPASDSSYNSSFTSYKSTDSSRSNRPLTPNNENKATYSGAVGGRSPK